MTKEGYHGVMRSGSIVLLEKNASIPEGTEVLVTPVASTPSSGAAILAALAAAPKVPGEWVDELEQIIAEGRRPPACLDPFPEELGSQEFQ